MSGPMVSQNAVENVIFHEVQWPRQQAWIWGIVIPVAGLVWYGFLQQIVLGEPFGSNPAPDIVLWLLWLAFGIGFPWFFYSMRLTTEVTRGEIRIHFFPLCRRVVPLADLKSFQVRQYRPVRDYGGWGIRWAPGQGWAYNVSGNRGLQLKLPKGKRLLIGSQKPEELAQKIAEAAR